MSRPGAVPVIMYHRVGPEIDNWQWSNDLTVSASTFEDHLLWLKKRRYHTSTLEELRAHMAGDVTLPEQSVVLTFDDGYVDTWTYAVPLLQHYGFRGSVAVVPEFVDPRDLVRPPMAAGGAEPENSSSEIRAFMSWPELRKAVDSGILEAVSHSLTHTWFPKGPRIVDFHHPGDAYYWLDWNHTPDRKPYYLERPDNSRVAWGTPVYENARALQMTRYFPDPDEADAMTDFVASRGGKDFFETPGWRDVLHEEARRRRELTPPAGRYETADERGARYRRELLESKRVMEERLGREVRHFIWPGQVFNEEAMEIARSVFDSVDASLGDAYLHCFNRPGEDPGRYRRFGVPDIEQPEGLYYPGGRYFVACLDEFRGLRLARPTRRAMKLFYLLGARTGGFKAA